MANKQIPVVDKTEQKEVRPYNGRERSPYQDLSEFFTTDNHISAFANVQAHVKMGDGARSRSRGFR